MAPKQGSSRGWLRHAGSRLTFDRSNPQHFGCLLLFNVKVTPRPLPPYEPGKVLEHAPSREAPSRRQP